MSQAEDYSQIPTIDQTSPIKNWFDENTKFLDRWVVIWIILSMVLLLSFINQLYLSIGNETFKQRQAYEWTQFGFLIIIPVLASFLVWHQKSHLGSNVNLISNGSSLILVILLSIAAIALQTYVIYGNEKFHRKRLLELGLLAIVFVLVGATMMAVQPVF